MNTAEQVLVIYLSTALAVFLVIAIVAGVYTLRLLKTMQRVADKAESFVNSAEAVGEMVRQTAGALSITKLLHGLMNFVHSKQGKEDDSDNDKKEGK
jgi:hypothetical protein